MRWVFLVLMELFGRSGRSHLELSLWTNFIFFLCVCVRERCVYLLVLMKFFLLYLFTSTFSLLSVVRFLWTRNLCRSKSDQNEIVDAVGGFSSSINSRNHIPSKDSSCIGKTNLYLLLEDWFSCLVRPLKNVEDLTIMSDSMTTFVRLMFSIVPVLILFLVFVVLSVVPFLVFLIDLFRIQIFCVFWWRFFHS